MSTAPRSEPVVTMPVPTKRSPFFILIAHVRAVAQNGHSCARPEFTDGDGELRERNGLARDGVLDCMARQEARSSAPNSPGRTTETRIS